MKTKSIRTQYRVKRRKIIKSFIIKLIDFHAMNDTKLERIPIRILKNIKKELEEAEISANPYERDMSG